MKIIILISIYSFFQRIVSINLAYVIAVHSNITAESAGRLLNVIYSPNDCFVVHIDNKSDVNGLKNIINKTFKCGKNKAINNIHYISLENVGWGRFTLTLMEYRSLNYSFYNCKNNFTHSLMLSGDSYPIKPIKKIKKFFYLNQGHSIISNFNGANLIGVVLARLIGRIPKDSTNLIPLSKIRYGPNWIVLNKELMNYCFTDTFPKKLLHYFSNARISDELYFQTLIENSDFKNKNINTTHVFTKFGCFATHPCFINDLQLIDEAINSTQLFARKIQNKTICEIINKKIGLKECPQCDYKYELFFLINIVYVIFANCSLFIVIKLIKRTKKKTEK